VAREPAFAVIVSEPAISVTSTIHRGGNGSEFGTGGFRSVAGVAMLISSISNPPGLYQFKSLEFGTSTVKLCSTMRGIEINVPGPALTVWPPR
jgi:hypothetical protein